MDQYGFRGMLQENMAPLTLESLLPEWCFIIKSSNHRRCFYSSVKRASIPSNHSLVFGISCVKWTWNKDEQLLASKAFSQMERRLKEKDSRRRDSGSLLPFSLVSVSSVSCDFHINIWVTLNNLEACSDTTGCEAEWRPATASHCLCVRVDLCIFTTRIPNMHSRVNRQKLKKQPCMRKSGDGGNRHSNGAHSLPRERSQPARGFSPAHTQVMFKPIIQEQRHVNTTYFPSNGGARGGETKTLAERRHHFLFLQRRWKTCCMCNLVSWSKYSTFDKFHWKWNTTGAVSLSLSFFFGIF